MYRLPLLISLYLGLFIIVMGANPFYRETIAPVGLLKNYGGWASHDFLSPPSHPERGDILDSVIPQWIALKSLIRNGESGLWNPLPSIGKSGIAELTRGALTPFFLAFLLVKPHWLGFYFAGLIKLTLAALGTYLFLNLFIRAEAAFCGGVLFALSGFNAAWFPWPQVATSAWIPWSLWACAGWFIYRSRMWIIANALITAALLLGGFPAVSAYGLYSVALLALFMTIRHSISVVDALRSISLWASTIIVGFMLCAIPLFALSEMLHLTDLSYRIGGTAYQFPQDLLLLIDAFHDGLPRVERTLFVGGVSLILSLFAVGGLLIYRNMVERTRLLGYYGLLLFVLSLVITYGVLPHRLLTAIPAIGTSPWSRFGIIVDLSIAILAAIGINDFLSWSHRLQSLRKYRLVMGVFLLCIGFQLYSQAKLFRTFNSIAFASDFFPDTPALSAVSRTLKPMQNVVADNSYLIGGTLGAYGIAEWFAHDFKTNEEKNVLQRVVEAPFRTPTAATFAASSLRLNADLYARLGIRYVLQDSNFAKTVRKQSHLPPFQPAPPLPKNKIAQVVRVDENISISSIGIMLATYHAPYSPADAVLEVIRDSGEIIAKSRLDKKKISDNKNAIFDLHDVIELIPGLYHLKLTLLEKPVKGNLTAWYTQTPNHEGDYLLFNNTPHPGALLYTLYGRTVEDYPSKEWKRHLKDNCAVVTYENLTVPSGAYWISGLEETAPWAEDHVKTIRTEASTVRVEYTGYEHGFIVVPMRFYPGWVAYVDGVEKQLQSYLGILPAIAVNGPASIQMVYRPDWLGRGSVIMLAAILLLIVLYGKGDQRQLGRK